MSVVLSTLKLLLFITKGDSNYPCIHLCITPCNINWYIEYLDHKYIWPTKDFNSS